MLGKKLYAAIVILALLLLVISVDVEILTAQSEPSCDDVTQIARSECEALLAIYNSEPADSWIRENWFVNDTICDTFLYRNPIVCWFGNITKLDLEQAQLSSLSSEIGHLTSLDYLRLRKKQIG